MSDKLQWLKDAASEQDLPLHILSDDGKVPWLDQALLETLDHKLHRNCIIITTEETRYTTTTAIMAWENNYAVYIVYVNLDTNSTENAKRLESLGIHVMSLEHFKSHCEFKQLAETQNIK